MSSASIVAFCKYSVWKPPGMLASSLSILSIFAWIVVSSSVLISAAANTTAPVLLLTLVTKLGLFSMLSHSNDVG